MIFIIFMETAEPLFKKALKVFPSSLAVMVPRPTRIEKMIRASKLLRDRSCEKSPTVRLLAKRCKIPAEALSSATVFINPLNNSGDSPEAGLKILKLMTPNIPEITTVMENTIIDVKRILPRFLELGIFAMEDEMLKKTIGISKVKIKFINMSPKGAKKLAFSPRIKPIHPPMKVASNRIIDAL